MARNQIISWINKTLPLLTERRAKERLSALAASTKNIGEYLYASGRCAVAHAFTALWWIQIIPTISFD